MSAARFVNAIRTSVRHSSINQLLVTPSRHIRTVRVPEQAAAPQLQTQYIPDTEQEDRDRLKGFFDKVNHEIESKRGRARLFAICHMYGQQHMFTEGDYIMVRKHFPADIGTRVKLEKCMLVGGENFTLIGRPVLDRDLVHIEATLVEKTMSQTDTNLILIPKRSGYRKWYFTRQALSILRINEIRVCHRLNESQSEVL